jgi:hypothetical protein
MSLKAIVLKNRGGGGQGQQYNNIKGFEVVSDRRDNLLVKHANFFERKDIFRFPLSTEN